jgi:lambda family phage portal protein
MGMFRDLYDIYLDYRERKYAAAKSSPTTGIPWQGSTTQNDEFDTSWDTVVQRTSGLIRDFPVFSGAVNNREAFVVGRGIRPQVVVEGTDGKIDKETSQKIEEAFMKWADSPELASTNGRLTFWEMQALSERQECEFGEFLFVENIDRKQKYSLAPIEPTTLSDPGLFEVTKTNNGNVLWRGIEYNPTSQKIKAYHFTDPVDANDFNWKTIRINSERVIHSFKTLRPGQLRGMSDFASAILSAYALRDYETAEMDAQKMSSKWMAFVTAPPSGNFSQNFTGNIQENELYGRYLEAIDNATIQYLKSGESVTMNTMQRSSGAFADFNEIVIRRLSASSGLPYELLSQDYSGLNFTTLRAVRNDFKQALRPRWERKISHLCQRVFKKWLRIEVLSGRISLPGYFENPERYEKIAWITPALENIDPLKEFQADLLKVRAGAKSMQEVIKEMGGDPEKTLKDQISWKEQLDEADLVFPELSSQDVSITNFEENEIEAIETGSPADTTSDEKEETVEEERGVDDEGNLYLKREGKWILESGA